MLHEKPNESFHWKKKLDELDHLPGEPVQDKTVSWEKLYDRLREKPRHKKMMWYWVAAACLLLMAGIQWIRMNEEDHQVVADKRTNTPPKSADSLIILKENPVVVPPELVIEKEQSNPVPSKEKNKQVFIGTVVTNEQVKSDSGTTQEPLPPIIVNTLKSEDSIALVTVVPQKKKLRVVHINELDKPVKEEIQFARNASLDATFFRQDRSQGFLLSRNASDNIVKIKLSPSN